MAPGPRAACRHSPVALGLLRPCAVLFTEVLCFFTGLCDLGACPGPLQASCSCFPAGVSPCTFDPARFHSASAQGICQPLSRRHSWERSHCLQVGAWDPGVGAPPYVTRSGTHWTPRVGLRRGGPTPSTRPFPAQPGKAITRGRGVLAACCRGCRGNRVRADRPSRCPGRSPAQKVGQQVRCPPGHAQPRPSGRLGSSAIRGRLQLWVTLPAASPPRAHRWLRLGQMRSGPSVLVGSQRRAQGTAGPASRGRGLTRLSSWGGVSPSSSAPPAPFFPLTHTSSTPHPHSLITSLRLVSARSSGNWGTCTSSRCPESSTHPFGVSSSTILSAIP